MCLVDCHAIGTQDYTLIGSLSQEHGSELSIALDPPKES
jgi:hypothetical protein